MVPNIPPDIERIVNALRQRDMQVTGPTDKNGETVYRINEHLLTEGELRTLSTEDRLTTWEIFNYVKTRDQYRMR